MKYAVAAIVIFCVVIFTFFAFFDLEISITSKKPSPQKIAGHLSENKPEQTIEPVGSTQDITVSPAPAATAIAEPPADASPPAIVSSEQPTIPTKDPDPSPNDKLPPQPAAATIVKLAVNQPTLPISNKPTQSFGLLTDTGETENNGIFEPHSTQVHPTHPRKAGKKTEPLPAETIIEDAAGPQIAILPEGSYPFSILLETFDKQANAQRAVVLYRKRGLAGFWVKINLGSSGVKYRLFTGIFPTEAAAQTFQARHHLKAQRVKNASYSCRIGTFHDQKELSQAFAKTTEAGVFPYILGKEGGPFFLYTGAFYTADGAENQCRELVEKGLPCQAVLRSTLPPKN